MSNKTIGNEPIYDAKQLGPGKVLILGIQHVFAMFGGLYWFPH